MLSSPESALRYLNLIDKPLSELRPITSIKDVAAVTRASNVHVSIGGFCHGAAMPRDHSRRGNALLLRGIATPRMYDTAIYVPVLLALPIPY
jgi:hypothetical protein